MIERIKSFYNFWIWLTVVTTNTIGVFSSLMVTPPDHHSPAAELEAILRNATKKLENKTTDEECERALAVLRELQELLQKDLSPARSAGMVVVCIDKPDIRQRLIL